MRSMTCDFCKLVQSRQAGIDCEFFAEALKQRRADRAHDLVIRHGRYSAGYLALRSRSSIDTPSGARMKQTRTPGRTVVGSRVNSTPLAFRSAAIASIPLTDSPK